MAKGIPNLRKAAILVASVDRRTAHALISQLLPEQIEDLQRAVSELGEIDPRERETVLSDFADHTPIALKRRNLDRKLLPDDDTGVQLSLSSTGYADHVAEPLGERRLDAGKKDESRPGPSSGTAQPSPPQETQKSRSEATPDTTELASFAFLQQADDAQLAKLLDREHPQTVTVVISRLAPRHAARVLARLPETQQADIVRRLVHLEEMHPDVLRELEAGLAQRFDQRVLDGQPSFRGIRSVVDMLQADGPRTGHDILRNVRVHDEKLAETLVGPRVAVRFNDLFHMDASAWAKLVHRAEAETVALALLGVPAEAMENVLRQVSPVAAMAIRQKVHHPGPVRLNDIDLAQQALAKLAEHMISQGQLSPPDNHA